MFGLFKRKPTLTVDQVFRNVSNRLSNDAKTIGRAQLQCNQSMFELYGWDFDRSRKLYALSLAFTSFFVEKYWGKAANLVMSDVDSSTRASIFASPETFTGVDDDAVQMRKSTDLLLNQLLKSEWGIGPLTGFCDILSNEIDAPYMRGSDVMSAVRLGDIITALERSIAESAKSAES